MWGCTVRIIRVLRCVKVSPRMWGCTFTKYVHEFTDDFSHACGGYLNVYKKLRQKVFPRMWVTFGLNICLLTLLVFPTHVGVYRTSELR